MRKRQWKQRRDWKMNTALKMGYKARNAGQPLEARKAKEMGFPLDLPKGMQADLLTP